MGRTSTGAGPAGSPTGEERRRYRRFPADYEVVYLEVGAEPVGRRARLRDVSLGGVCMLTDEAIEMGTRVVVGIYLEEGQEPLVATSRVRYSRSEPHGFAHGLEFLWMEARDRAAYERLARHFLERYGETGA